MRDVLVRALHVFTNIKTPGATPVIEVYLSSELRLVSVFREDLRFESVHRGAKETNANEHAKFTFGTESNETPHKRSPFVFRSTRV